VAVDHGRFSSKDPYYILPVLMGLHVSSIEDDAVRYRSTAQAMMKFMPLSMAAMFVVFRSRAAWQCIFSPATCGYCPAVYLNAGMTGGGHCKAGRGKMP